MIDFGNGPGKGDGNGLGGGQKVGKPMKQGGKCLEPSREMGWEDNILELVGCKKNRYTQNFIYDKETREIKQLGLCLEVTGFNWRARMVPCTGGRNQQWTAKFDQNSKKANAVYFKRGRGRSACSSNLRACICL